MSTKIAAALHLTLVAAVLSMPACGGTDFPVTPSPVVRTDVTTLGGGTWSGNVLLSDGTTTSFNMTLIARALGLTTGSSLNQTAGTTEVTGSFETGSGLRGAVRGSLIGTLQDGSFRGSLEAESPACSRDYAGPITESTVAWVPFGALPAGCLLTFSIQLPRERGPDCQYAITINEQSFSGSGGSGQLTVATSAGCTWVAESVVPWIQFTDNTPRVGPGTASFQVGRNDEGAREGQVRLAHPNQTFTIRQGAGCNISVSPASATVPGAGGTGRFTVTAAAGCEWTAQSGADWLTVSPAKGTGSSDVTFSAQPNPGLTRQATVSIGGQTVAVVQAAGCLFTVTPTTAEVPLGGGGGTVSISGASGCTWTAESTVSWLTVAPATGAGNGTVAYTALANTGPPRQGAVRVAGQSVTILQGTCSAPITVILTLTNVAAGGGTGDIIVTAAQGCPWTATSNAPWITLSPTVGTGNGKVVLQVSANEGSARTGTIGIGGHVFTITQAARCTYDLQLPPLIPPDGEPPEGAGPFQVVVTAPAGCTWSVAAAQATDPRDPPWVRVGNVTGNGTTGNGNGQVTLTVDLNDTQAPRFYLVTLTGVETVLSRVGVQQFQIERPAGMKGK